MVTSRCEEPEGEFLMNEGPGEGIEGQATIRNFVESSGDGG